MPRLASHQYGKTQVKLTQVQRDGDAHSLTEVSISVLFRGDFGDSYVKGDNSKLLPTDTMKNTIYVLARLQAVEHIESFASSLAQHFLSANPDLDEVEIEIEQLPWIRIASHKSAFVLASTERRTTRTTTTRTQEVIVSGLQGLEVLKTGNSAFSGFLRDKHTTLPETRDRLLGTILNASWTYNTNKVDFNREHQNLRSVLLDTFATHVSESVQHTLYEMASVALRSSDFIKEIHLVMPNRHRLLVNLAHFGMDNPNQVFVPTEEPSGYIEARLTADKYTNVVPQVSACLTPADPKES